MVASVTVARLCRVAAMSLSIFHSRLGRTATKKPEKANARCYGPDNDEAALERPPPSPKLRCFLGGQIGTNERAMSEISKGPLNFSRGLICALAVAAGCAMVLGARSAHPEL